MLSNGKPKLFQLGPFTISGGNLIGGSWNEILLDKLPRNMQSGVGLLLRMEIQCLMTISGDAGNPAIPWYQLQRLMDFQLIGANNFTFRDSKGWHAPVRQYLKNGRFIGNVYSDVAAAQAGPYTRTVTYDIDFVERTMGNPLWRCQPVAAFKAGKLRLFPWTADNNVFTNHLKLTDVQVIVLFHILDVNPKKCPIGSFVQEVYQAGQLDLAPTPGLGQYLRCATVLDPATATFHDDLSSFTNVSFGANGATGYTIPVNTELVTSLMRRWNDGMSTDPKPIFGTLTSPPSDAFRFLDPVSNTSARLHALPLVTPARGDSIRSMPDWSDVAPQLHINFDQRAGTPASLDFLADRIVDRTDDQVKAILDAIYPGRSVSNKYRPDGSQVAKPFQGLVGMRRAPLTIDVS